MILAPTLSILSSGSGAIVRPTFSRDFAGEKTLNNGTGPAITFTRGSQATYFTADGTLRFAPHNAIRNSEAVGATNGVIWSPSAFVGAGSIPQWGSFRNFGSMEVVGSGTELGMRYVDVRISGSNTDPSNNGAQIIAFNALDNCVASSGQTWTSSASIRLVGGSLTNVLLVYLTTQGRQADTTSVEAESTTFTPSGTYQRVAATKTMTNASTARVSPDLTVVVAPSSTVDLTLRIAAPQLERNATASEYIPTTGTANFDQPRFDHDPATGASRGLLIEEARTNSIRNSQGGGSTNGVIGSGGVMPTNGWSISANANNVTSEVLGTGTEDGLAYIDIKISGTPSGNGTVFIQFLGANTQAASNGQTWTLSAYRRLIDGTVTNELIFVNVSGVTSASAAIVGQTQSTTAAPTGAALKTQRTSAKFTFSNATVAFVLPRAGLQYFSGSQIGGSAAGITLRIAAPQLEQGAFPTSYIPTTSAAVTRSADSAIVNPVSGFYNQAEGSVYTEHTQLAAITSAAADKFAWVSSFSDGSFENVLGNYSQLTSTTSGLGAAAKVVDDNNVAIAEVGFSTALPAATVRKFAFGYVTDDIATFRNGLVGGTDTDADLGDLQPLDRMGIGCLNYAVIGEFLNGHLRKIAYYPRRLSNALLQSLTT